MIVLIRDRDALSSVSIENMRDYLSSVGWADTGRWGERPISVFATERHGRTWEILVPHRKAIGGYAENVANTLEILAKVEDRSELDVFHDIMNAGSDIIRACAANGAGDKPLSLRQSVRLHDSSYKMVAAAARAAASDRTQANYCGNPRPDVLEYLDSVQPLQNGYSGYALRLRSPVAKEFDFGDDNLAPFPRRVTLKLAEALRSSGDAIAESVAEDDLEPFRNAVPSGVSSNLCDALAELAKDCGGMEIGLSWAASCPPSSSVARNPRFTFSERSADILSEAARVFRRDEPSMDELVVAHVVKFEKDPEQFDGRATLSWNRENRPVRLRSEFERAAYETVIKAFRERAPLKLTGDIYREGREYELRNPRDISIPKESA